MLLAAQGQQASEEPAAVRKARRAGWGLLLAGCLVLVAWSAVTGLALLRRARSIEAHVGSLEALAQSTGEGRSMQALEPAGVHLSGMRRDLEAIRNSVGPLLPLGRILRYLPRHGGDLLAASDLLDLAVGAVSAGDRVYRSLAPSLIAEPTPAVSLGERFVPIAIAAQPALETARDELTAARQARDRIDAGLLSPRVAGLLKRLDGILPWLETAVDGLLLAPEALGAGGSRTYLLVAQNNHELRPTGGFISGVGELTVEGGRVSSFAFGDSYAVDNWDVPHDLAPADMRTTLAGEIWLFRDANWQADFPTSARKAMEIYARDRGVVTDGVIALDLTGLVSLVDALGPLAVEGIDGPVTGENVVEAIQAGWQTPPHPADSPASDWYEHRKDSFGPIATAALDRLLNGSELDLARLARDLNQALTQKHILVYLDDPPAAELLKGMGWDGALRDPSGLRDWLMVADTNVGFNKVDGNVERSIAYRVDLSNGSRPSVRLTLTYRNKSQRRLLFCVQAAQYGDTYADMMNRCYWDYVRVYVPAGSKLLKGPSLAMPAGSLSAQQPEGSVGPPLTSEVTEGEWTAWTAFFDLAPGDEQALTFEYRLPSRVLERSRDRLVYRLDVQKQPGTDAVPFCLEVLPPPDYALAEWSPAELPLQGQACTDLRIDRAFEIVYHTRGIE